MENTMQPSLHAIEQQSRLLKPVERAQLAEIMLESLRDSSSSEVEAAWQQEIAERVAAYERGELKTYSAEKLFAEADRMA